MNWLARFTPWISVSGFLAASTGACGGLWHNPLVRGASVDAGLDVSSQGGTPDAEASDDSTDRESTERGSIERESTDHDDAGVKGDVGLTSDHVDDGLISDEAGEVGPSPDARLYECV